MVTGDGYGKSLFSSFGGWLREKVTGSLCFLLLSQFLRLDGKFTGGYGRRLREVTGEGYGR